MRKVIVVGLDGLEPRIVERMLANDQLPNMARVRASGGYARVATTCPAQTPVAWATFATGTNPGGHGIFDFIRRNPETYLPELALNRYEQASVFLPPKVVNLRRGTPVWELLSAAGIPSVILRCPCTYGPDNLRGRMLSGMGVPDLRGGLGIATFYTSDKNVKAAESEDVVHVSPGAGGTVRTHLIGPRDPKTKLHCRFEITIERGGGGKQVVVHSAGRPRSLVVRVGQWSDWLRVKFKLGLLRSVRGMVRFFLPQSFRQRTFQAAATEGPDFELYASPINFDPYAPAFPISFPPGYARELADELGLFYTTGMVEDHGGFENGRLDELAFLAQCDDAWREREQMMLRELDRQTEGLLFCLFDTPDRVQHMFWRYLEPGHPAALSQRAGGRPRSDMAHVIDDVYRKCDEIVGKALEYVDDQTLLVVLSDHGLGSFQRGVHLNTWLLDHGLLSLKGGIEPGPETGNLRRNVDWSRTRAYALGLGGIYLNLAGREAEGIVTADEIPQIQETIVKGLQRLRDPARGTAAVRSVRTRQEVYTGPYAGESPDLMVNFAQGYRVSWGTALGGLPRGHFEDNVKKWSGDHLIDPVLVPGVLLMNRPFRGEGSDLVDLAPTILAALEVPKGPAMEGKSLLI